MSGPTPGPWHVEHGTPSGRRLVADLVAGEGSLTHYRIVHDGEAEGDARADADVLAAAPVLLEAARRLSAMRLFVEIYDGKAFDKAALLAGIACADAAIAQADGRGARPRREP